MYNFTLNENTPLTLDKLGMIILKFMTLVLPILNKWKHYYDGKQAIFFKKATDEGKPCNKIMVNFCRAIVNNYTGYLTGKPIRYTNDNFEAIQDILKYNDQKDEDTDLLRKALIFGRAFEINYVDEEGKLRFKVLDSRLCIPVYDDTISKNLLYVIRFWKDDILSDDKYTVEVYSAKSVLTYQSAQGFSSFILIDEKPNYYKQVPITIFSLNDDEESIFNLVMSLLDGYNTLLSGEVDDFESFADAYLVMKGVIADESDLSLMKRNRVLMMDTDADVSYLTKSISDTQIENMLQNVSDKIYAISACPDFNSEKFLAQSGVALKYKLTMFENYASSIESNMKKALLKRIELISEIISLTDNIDVWRDVSIVFTRNLPVDEQAIAQTLNQYRGLVSTETLLSQIPFILDAEEEYKKLQEEQLLNRELYGFGNESDEEEEDA